MFYFLSEEKESKTQIKGIKMIGTNEGEFQRKQQERGQRYGLQDAKEFQQVGPDVGIFRN